MLRILYFVFPLLLVGGLVAAAELPVPPGKQMVRADRAADRKLSQERFERKLLSSTGRGRLE